jgi:hypothetical protein
MLILTELLMLRLERKLQAPNELPRSGWSGPREVLDTVVMGRESPKFTSIK